MTTKNRTPAIQVKEGNSSQRVESMDFETTEHDRSIVLEDEMTLDQLRDSLNARVSPDINTADFKEFAGNMAFFEEEVLVRVLPSSEKNAEMVIDVYNDGIVQRFIRGEYIKCKRKYAEVLARAKPFGVTTPEMVDGNGDRTTAINVTHGQRYPFDMVDKNPHGRGQAWLQHILQES